MAKLVGYPCSGEGCPKRLTAPGACGDHATPPAHKPATTPAAPTTVEAPDLASIIAAAVASALNPVRAELDTLRAELSARPAVSDVPPTIEAVHPDDCFCGACLGTTAAPIHPDDCFCGTCLGTTAAPSTAPNNAEALQAKDAKRSGGVVPADLSRVLAPLAAFATSWSLADDGKPAIGPDTRKLSPSMRGLVLAYANAAYRMPESLMLTPRLDVAAGKVLAALCSVGPERRELYRSDDYYKAQGVKSSDVAVSMRATRMLALAAAREADAWQYKLAGDRARATTERRVADKARAEYAAGLPQNRAASTDKTMVVGALDAVFAAHAAEFLKWAHDRHYSANDMHVVRHGTTRRAS